MTKSLEKDGEDDDNHDSDDHDSDYHDFDEYDDHDEKISDSLKFRREQASKLQRYTSRNYNRPIQ